MLFLRLQTTFFLLLFFSFSLFAYPNISQSVKEKQVYPMGKKIYAKKCTNQNLKILKSYEKLLHAIEDKKVCGNLNAKYAEALALYVWDIQRKNRKKYAKLVVSKTDKCPVCGMYLHHYPNWVARINYSKDETYSFDGIKDMMKFYFNNEEGIVDVLVQDYYTLETINAREAYFVRGSDVYGPMGHELIAFKNEKSAKNFSLEHKGKEVLAFDKLTEVMVRSLDN